MRSTKAWYLALVTAVLTSVPALAGGITAESWIRGLYGKPSVTRGEVLLAAALIADENHWRPDPQWAARVAISQELCDADVKKELHVTARRGFAASIFARLLKVPGGLFMSLTGCSGRYSYRELAVLGWLPSGGESVAMNGDELAGLLVSATKYQEQGSRRFPVRSDLR